MTVEEFLALIAVVEFIALFLLLYNMHVLRFDRDHWRGVAKRLYESDR